MSRQAKTIAIKGHQLTCPICQGKEFWSRETLMNTAGATFLGFEWANKSATNYVCNHCGYVYWFISK